MEQKCYICQSSNTSIESFTLQGDNRTLNILICQECNHASRIDQPDFRENLKNQENRFAEITHKPRSNLSWHNREVLVAVQLERMVPKRGKILDIGCSSGQWLGLLSEEWDKYGVDLSSVAANMARQYTNASIFCGPI
ncbi:MAG: class I SAM-dependent methyltransferase, partial [Planctomycetota bacterium]